MPKQARLNFPTVKQKGKPVNGDSCSRSSQRSMPKSAYSVHRRPICDSALSAPVQMTVLQGRPMTQPQRRRPAAGAKRPSCCHLRQLQRAQARSSDRAGQRARGAGMSSSLTQTLAPRPYEPPQRLAPSLSQRKRKQRRPRQPAGPARASLTVHRAQLPPRARARE